MMTLRSSFPNITSCSLKISQHLLILLFSEFIATVTVNGKEYRSTSHLNKKTATQEAAYRAYVHLEAAPPTTPAGAPLTNIDQVIILLTRASNTPLFFGSLLLGRVRVINLPGLYAWRTYHSTPADIPQSEGA